MTSVRLFTLVYTNPDLTPRPTTLTTFINLTPDSFVLAVNEQYCLQGLGHLYDDWRPEPRRFIVKRNFNLQSIRSEISVSAYFLHKNFEIPCRYTVL